MIIAKKLLVVCAALLSAAFCRADGKVLWVDAKNYGRTDVALTGESKELAFGTIHEAVAAAGNDYTIRVLPGVYSNGVQTAGYASITPARVAVYGKENLLIISEKGAAETIIRGNFANGSDRADGTAIGEDAVGCIIVGGVEKFRLEGFTLERGATLAEGEDKSVCYGAAFNGRNAKESGIFMVDCIVKDCAAGWGVLYGVTAIRCRIYGNYTKSNVSASGLIRASKLYCSVVAHNSCRNLLSVNSMAVNSTFADNHLGVRFSRNKDCSVYNSILQSSGKLDSDYVVSENCVVGGCQVMGTAVDDWRLIDGSDAETAGMAEHLKKISIPEDCKNKDLFSGNIPETGAIAAGAVQAQFSATPAAGGVHWLYPFEVNGVKCVEAEAYAFPSSYPTQWRCRAIVDSGKFLLRYKIGDKWSPLEMDDSIMLMPPPGTDNVSTTTCEMASKAIWVDAKNGSDTGGTGSSESPYGTLQKASSEAVSGTVIFANPGTYETGGESSYGCGNRVLFKSKVVRIIGVKGASKTFIKGEADKSSLSASSIPGCGPDSRRCVAIEGGGGQIQGFTLLDGNTQAATNGSEEDRGSAVWYAGNPGFWVTDSVISNCSGGTCGILRNVNAMRCRFSNCRGANSLFSPERVLAFCEIDSLCMNESADDGIINCSAYHVSMAGSPAQNPFDDNSMVRALCLVASGKKVFASASLSGCIFGTDIQVDATLGFESDDPRFADAEAKDFRVLDSSKALSVGESPTSSNYGADYWLYASRDINGETVRFADDGRPMSGALMSPVKGVYITDANGALSVVGGKLGANLMEEDSSIKLAMGRGDRPCIGFTLNGATNLFDDVDGLYAITSESLAGGSLEVKAIYSNKWYVDANNGVDDELHTGFTPKTAKKTMEKVLELTQEGDTVHAAHGVYKAGKMYPKEGTFGASRVVLPTGVTLVASGDVNETIIEGENASEPDDYGLGADAVRCVMLEKDSRIKGFRLRCGRTSTGTSADVCRGGAVIGRQWDRCFVEDCIIEDNAAYEGGGCMKATLVKCHIKGNKATSETAGASGSATMQCAQYGCIVNGNFGRNAIYANYMLNSCTVGPSNHSLSGKSACTYDISAPQEKGKIFNSLICGTVLEREGHQVYRCVIAGKIPESQLEDGSKVVDDSELAFDDFGRPVIGSNKVIDSANMEYCSLMPYGEYDILGGQRVYNGCMDIGAVEADWRPVYSRLLGSGVVVTHAGSKVKNMEGGVLIPAGELAATVSARPAGGVSRYSATAYVTGSGSLDVFADDVLLQTIDNLSGVCNLAFQNTAASCNYKFVYTPGDDDVGGAVIASIKRINGFSFVVR